jgi:uncharacterized protein
LKLYTIQFASLKPGAYTFDFEISDKFFEHFDESEIKKGKVNVQIGLEKQSRLMVLDFNLKGFVSVMCDRCLVDFDLAIESDQKLIVKFGNEKKEETDEIITIAESDHEIDVAQFIYEYIHLSLPPKRVHLDNEKGESQCDPVIIKKLEEHKGKEIETPDNDPRWEALKKIKFN